MSHLDNLPWLAILDSPDESITFSSNYLDMNWDGLTGMLMVSLNNKEAINEFHNNFSAAEILYDFYFFLKTIIEESFELDFVTSLDDQAESSTYDITFRTFRTTIGKNTQQLQRLNRFANSINTETFISIDPQLLKLIPSELLPDSQLFLDVTPLKNYIHTFPHAYYPHFKISLSSLYVKLSSLFEEK